MKKKILNGMIVIAVVWMAISGMILLLIWYKDEHVLDYWKNIAAFKETEGDWTGQGILPEYQSLYDMNQDMVGWIHIDSTHIDYPVMQVKEDPERYLRKNFDKEYDYQGTPFVDYRCDVVPYRSFNTIIYGHYTSQDSMFRWLLNYAYENWYEKHKYIQFDTLHEKGVYEVAAVFYVDASDIVLMDQWDKTAEDAYTFYNYIEIDSKEGFEKFRSNIEKLKIYDTEAEITMESRLITLICCAPKEYSGIEENGRIVVIAEQ